MRILLVSYFYEHDHGGAEMVAREARRLMTETLGWEIDVLCLDGGIDRGEGIQHVVTSRQLEAGFRGTLRGEQHQTGTFVLVAPGGRYVGGVLQTKRETLTLSGKLPPQCGVVIVRVDDRYSVRSQLLEQLTFGVRHRIETAESLQMRRRA